MCLRVCVSGQHQWRAAAEERQQQKAYHYMSPPHSSGAHRPQFRATGLETQKPVAVSACETVSMNEVNIIP